MDSSDIKLKALEENNNDLTLELNNKKRSLRESQDQIELLKKEKNEWQELYLKILPAKRSSDDPVPHGDKRSRTEGGYIPEHLSSSVEVKSDPPRGDLSNRRISEVVINMWKEQCRKVKRYIPDKPQSGPNATFPHAWVQSWIKHTLPVDRRKQFQKAHGGHKNMEREG
jgi:hypothetical protein